MKTRHLIFCLFLAAMVSQAATGNSLPKFDEVYQVLGTNLAGVTPDELNRAGVQGLLDQLAPRVTLVSAPPGGPSAASNPAPLAQTRVFDQSFAYFRVTSVNSKLPEAFREAYRAFNETNGGKIKGIVLDLRFADGADYQAAAKTADFFLNSDQPLLDWQQGSAKATKKTDAILAPVAILINSQTTGAAETLAAVLRETGAGLILGSDTAGQASVFKEFPLSNGDKLRVAVAGVIVGEGNALTNGVAPDIAVDTSLQDERAYLQDPYKDLHPAELAQADTGTNGSPEPRPRFNEAELVREHSAGQDADNESDDASPVIAEPGPPVVADPTLVRALDLLKGLAVVEPNRPD
jgi:carboxyl-terminal processing protease